VLYRNIPISSVAVVCTFVFFWQCCEQSSQLHLKYLSGLNFFVHSSCRLWDLFQFFWKPLSYVLWYINGKLHHWNMDANNDDSSWLLVCNCYCGLVEGLRDSLSFEFGTCLICTLVVWLIPIPASLVWLEQKKLEFCFLWTFNFWSFWEKLQCEWKEACCMLFCWAV
jgi:hypothetical protein